jgi:hypothetical protein
MEIEEIVKIYTDAIMNADEDLYYENGVAKSGVGAKAEGRKALENIGLSNSAILAFEDLIDKINEHTWNTGCIIQ